MASSPITSWQIDGEKVQMVGDFIFLGSKISVDNDCSHKIKRQLLLGRKAMTNLDSALKSRNITLLKKLQYSQSYGFSSSHVWMWEWDHQEGWVLKNWCFWIVLERKPLESPLDSMEIKPVNPKGNQSWIFIRRTVAEAEVPILWQRSWCWERLRARGEQGNRGGGGQMSWLDSVGMNLSMLQEIVKDRGAWRAVVHGVSKSWTRLSDWTTTCCVYQWLVLFIVK